MRLGVVCQETGQVWFNLANPVFSTGFVKNYPVLARHSDFKLPVRKAHYFGYLAAILGVSLVVRDQTIEKIVGRSCAIERFQEIIQVIKRRELYSAFDNSLEHFWFSDWCFTGLERKKLPSDINIDVLGIYYDYGPWYNEVELSQDALWPETRKGWLVYAAHDKVRHAIASRYPELRKKSQDFEIELHPHVGQLRVLGSVWHPDMHRLKEGLDFLGYPELKPFGGIQ